LELKKKQRFELDDEEKAAILKEVLSNANEHNGMSMSNGMLMRISPLGIALRNIGSKK
jgi:ADP-ribosylglycohydrolase